MATKIKKENFDRYTVKGFKIGDTIEIKEANVQAEIIAVDLDKDCLYAIMIDATQINLRDYDVIDVPIEDCRINTVYYRKKALKKEYKIWVNVDKVEHVCDTNTRENVSENQQEESVDEDSSSDDDTFMIEDYLKDDYNPYYSEFYLKPKYNGNIIGSSGWSDETYTSKDSLIEVNYDEAEYFAIVFDPDNNSSKEKLLEALLESSEKMSNVYTLNKIIMDNLTLANNDTPAKDLIQDILHDSYIEDIIRSYRWNNRGMCAVLIKVRHE